ncbi:MAG: hypothetical protein HY582_03940 [Candidatus Omnitrophica bacterium]|nr:hypothetical protein [Candidatus Omnitrophota bacterium]
MKFTKIAIVLVFLLSATAFTLTAFLATIRENEKAKRVALETVRVQLEEKIQMLDDEKLDFKKQVDALNKELEGATASLNANRSSFEQLRSELEAKNKVIEEKQHDIDELERAIQISQERNQELEATLEAMERSLMEMRRGDVEIGSEPESVEENKDATSEKPPETLPAESPADAKRVTLATISDEQKEPVYNPSVEKIMQTEPEPQGETSLSVSKISDTSSGRTSVPTSGTSLQAGRVLLVNRKFNFVVINVGSKQGLKVGDIFMISNGTEKISKVEVEKLYDDFAAAKIVDQFGEASLLKEGNLVTRA